MGGISVVGMVAIGVCALSCRVSSSSCKSVLVFLYAPIAQRLQVVGTAFSDKKAKKAEHPVVA
jgi:hypothetical protein